MSQTDEGEHQESASPAPSTAHEAIVALVEGAEVLSSPDSDPAASMAGGDLRDVSPDEPPPAKRGRGRPRKYPAGDGEPKPKRPKQSASLIGLTENWRLWHAPDGTPFAGVLIDRAWHNMPIRSRAMRQLLASLAWKELGLTPSSQGLEDSLRILEARAINEGPERAPARRYMREGDKLYVDLGMEDRAYVEIDRNGWRVVRGLDLPFIRSPRMRALCEPEAGGKIEDFRAFANVLEETDWVNLCGLVVGAVRPRGPYAIGVVGGEQGTGKSTLCRRIRDIIDPCSPALQGPPKDEGNIIVVAQNSFLLIFDNQSSIPGDISDALCRLSTGSGFAVRALHTDSDENVFEGARPIFLNGITTLVSRPDLSERAVTIRLAVIPPEKRRPEDEIDAEWELARPRILGAVYDAASAALRHIGETSLKAYNRMADYEKWLTAAEPGLGWDPGTFSQAYADNRRDLSETTFESDQVAVAIADFIKEDHPKNGWCGTATRLLYILTERVTEAERRAMTWPKTAQGLGDRLKRIAPLLRGRNIHVEWKHSGERKISLVPMGRL